MMPVLHTVKKKTALAASPVLGHPKNAEYEDYRQRLSSIKNSMVASVASINDNVRRFNKLYISIRNFSERFVENYPVEKEETKSVARACEAESQELWEHFVKETGDWAPYKKIHDQIRVYINEIREVESKYFELNTRKVELERYQRKLDKIALASSEPEHEGVRGKIDDILKRTKGDIDARKTRNMTKLERVKRRYLEQLSEVITAQKLTYSKHETVFRAALAAYWLAHDSHVSCLLKCLSKTVEFAHAHECEMVKLDVPTMDFKTLIKAGEESPREIESVEVFEDARDSAHSSLAVQQQQQVEPALHINSLGAVGSSPDSSKKTRSSQGSRNSSKESSMRASQRGEGKEAPVAA